MTAETDTLAPRIGPDLTAEQLLRFYREPARFDGEARRRNAPFMDSDVILKLALGRRIAFADPALNEVGTVMVLKSAAAMYVRHVFFRPDATPYQMLGLAPGASAQAIKESFRLLMQLVHPDRQDSDDVWPESFAALANRAYGVLRDQHARAAYDRDAEARARVAREVYRKAAAVEASMMPVPVRPAGRVGGRRPLGAAVMPEWLTAGVGGYVRAHPAVAAYGVLIAGAALVVLISVRDGPEGLLAREVRETMAPATPAHPAPVRVALDGAAPDPATLVPRAAPEASIGVSVDAERPDQPMARPRRADTASAVSEVIRVPSTTRTADTTASSSSGDPAGVGATSAMVANASPMPAAVPAPPVVADDGAPPPAAPALPPATPALPPASPEIEALFADFVDSYQNGRLDAFVALFDEDADTNLRHGRAAIRSEYDELFRLSNWRRMQVTRINWRRAGDRAYAKGEIAVRIGWRDGREVEQRVAIDVELVRRDGRAVIARLSHQPRNP